MTDPGGASGGAEGPTLTRVAKAERCFFNVFAFLLLLLMAGIVAQVLLSYFDVNPVLAFESSYFLIGDAVTLNSLLDAQWHLLVIIALIPAGLVLLYDRHVRVDFLYAQYSPRRQAATDVVGHAIFAIPFLYFTIPAAISFAQSAFRSGQGSSNGGLNDLFLIKAALPIGLTLLALAVLVDLVRAARRVLGR